MTDQVGREPQYEVFADEFRSHAEGGFHNAYYDRPACLALLGDVAGRHVLDAACGPGLSRPHPTGDWLRHGGSYFDSRVIAETWSKGWQLRYWHAPLERTCEEIFAAGFLIERLWEPRPQPEAAAIDGPEYELLSREPRGFIAFRLISPT